MNRNEQEMYKNIERIATALEKLVSQGKEDKLDEFGGNVMNSPLTERFIPTTPPNPFTIKCENKKEEL
tara:strand:- start:873 stop:1076 length:204 start_codon:yes stop_codon:yes gene_type:complete